MNTTTFERGLEQGLQQGLQQGREVGREEGQREALRILLEDKFGPLSPAVMQRINSLPADQLKELLRAVSKATTLQELRLQEE